MGEIKSAVKNAAVAGTGFGLGYIIGKLKYHRGKITLGIILSSTVLYTSISLVNNMPEVIKDNNKYSLDKEILNNRFNLEKERLNFKRDSLKIVYGLEMQQEKDDQIKIQNDNIQNQINDMHYKNNSLQDENTYIKNETGILKQTLRQLELDVDESKDKINNLLINNQSKSDASLERRVSYLEEKTPNKNYTKNKTVSQSNLYQQSNANTKSSTNTSRNLLSFILDADKSSHEMSLYKVFDDGSKELERSFPVNFAVGGNPKNGQYNVERILPSNSSTAPYFLEMKYPIGTAGAGVNSEFEYNILNGIDNNKTGMRITNDDMRALVKDIKDITTIVMIHD